MTDLYTQLTFTVKTRTYRETRCPYLKVTTNELFIKQITELNSPLFYNYSTLIYYYIYIYKCMYNPIYFHLPTCKIHTMLAITGTGMKKCLRCSTEAKYHIWLWLIKTYIYLSKHWPYNSTAGEWSNAGHEDKLLTTLPKSGGRSWLRGEVRQNIVKARKVWRGLDKGCCFVNYISL